MKKLLFSLSFLLASAIVNAAPRSIEQMKEVAKAVIRIKAGMATRGNNATLDVLKQGGQYTVIGYRTGGFAVIANDDRFEAVLGYSDSEFSSDNIPPAMQWWMDAAYAAMAAKAANGEASPVGSELRNDDYPASVDAIMTTTWSQEYPYNKRVYEISGIDYPSGCVATAMSQIMKYHNYPITGMNFKGYQINGHTINVDFENTTYRWDEMIDHYDAMQQNYTEKQADAVAELMLHCGVAVDMNYNSDGSGAYSYEAAQALRDYFKYSTKFHSRDVFTEEEWMNMIYDEISSGRPVLYGGVDPSLGGHAFVFDGYDDDGLVHVNWGWGGAADGFYDVAILNSGNGKYAYQQDMIIMHDADEPVIPYSSQWGIFPTLSWQTNTGQTFDTTGRLDMQADGTTLDFVCSNLMNCDADDFTGQLAIVAEPTDGSGAIFLKTEDVSGFGYYNVYPGNATDYEGTVDISGLADGTYRVYLASKATTEAAWQPVHYNENINGCYILTVDNGTSTVTTGIGNVTIPSTTTERDNRIYTIDGRYVGTDINNVGKGIYIYKGEKVKK